ncbi:MAG: sigma-70 family RNA polymerase sigma factor [Planctomycetota bacterium]
MVKEPRKESEGEQGDPCDPSDSVVIRRFLEGDSQAFDLLVARYETRVRSLLFRLLWNIDDAEEVTQDTFLRVLENAQQFRAESSFKTWIMKIATNLARDRQRQMKRRPVMKPIDPSSPCETAAGETDSPLDARAGKEERAAMQSALDRLPFLQRAALVMKITQGMRYKEIARALDSTEGSVKASIHEARKKVSTMLED